MRISKRIESEMMDGVPLAAFEKPVHVLSVRERGRERARDVLLGRRTAFELEVEGFRGEVLLHGREQRGLFPLLRAK